MGDAEGSDSAIEKLLAVPRTTPMTIRDSRAYLLEILMTFMRLGRDLDIARPPDGEPMSSCCYARRWTRPPSC